jgi:general secretion pathway protein D
MDNTDGFVQVGSTIARITGFNVTANTGVQTEIEDIEVGIILQIRPRVGSDGLIVMDVDASRTARDDNEGTLVPTGGIGGEVVLINDILRTTSQSTIAAYSGQTVILGGLIQKSRVQVSRRVPIVADVPVLGHFFKYDTEIEGRDETLLIMTPMLVTDEEDLDYVKEVESGRMSWCLADVVEAHGDVGLSGGYGLWGPTVGTTIYPDLHPTVEPIAIPRGQPDMNHSEMIDSDNGPLPPASGRRSQLPGNDGRRISSLGPNQEIGFPSPALETRRRDAPASSMIGMPVKPSTYPIPTASSLPAKQASWRGQPQTSPALGNPGAKSTGRSQRLSSDRLGAGDRLLSTD